MAAQTMRKDKSAIVAFKLEELVDAPKPLGRRLQHAITERMHKNLNQNNFEIKKEIVQLKELETRVKEAQII